jgi:hypothetical protein
MAFFLLLNLMICFFEIGLSLNHKAIQNEANAIFAKHGNPEVMTAASRWQVASGFFFADIQSAWKLSSWTRVWSTYCVYDPAYQSLIGFGYWIDSCNGYSTLIPSLLCLLGMTFDIVNPQVLGMIGLVSYWQEFYGTVVYFTQLFANDRLRGKSALEIVLFIVMTNGMWLVFPVIGMYVSYSMITTNSFNIVRK